MMNQGRVKLWGTQVGYFYLDESKGYISFEYDKEFVRSGIELSPIMMPLSNKVYDYPELLRSSFKGVPGLIADSLPDKFGNAVIDQWLVSQGRAINSFNVVERLCYTGKRGMGALEYEPDNSGQLDTDIELNMGKMADFASTILQEKTDVILSAKEDMDYKQLLRLGTSAGGARAKAVIGFNEKTNEIRSGQTNLHKDFEHWLVKFDGVSKNGDHELEDVIEYTLIEQAYYKMALNAGIKMNECRILSENGRNHFMTKRFDRVSGKKIHMQSLGAILHIDYDIPGLCSYERAALTGRQIGLPNSDIEEIYRRMVFNVMAVNQDDHVKNTSFLMDRNGKWSLSPAYDITFAYEANHRWLGAHQMTINGKSSGFTESDLIACAEVMDLKTSKCKKINVEVRNAVLNFREIASLEGIKDNTIQVIMNQIRKRID